MNDQLVDSLVSVAIAAYNASATIEDCLKSILEGNDMPIEIVVCDDASTDDTRERVKSLGDSRIRLIQSVENRGEGAARDTAIAACRSTWIALCDADDMWLPGRLVALMGATGGNPNIVAFDDIVECHDTRDGMVPWRRLRGNNAFGAHGESVRVELHDLISARRMLIKPLFSAARLDISGAKHGDTAFGADTYFFLKLVSRGGGLMYVPTAYYLYRITPRSASATVQRYRFLREVLQACLTIFLDCPVVYAALLEKVERMRKFERYREFLNAVKRRQFAVALGGLLNHPWIAWQFIVHNVKITPYRIHRFIKGGESRGTK